MRHCALRPRTSKERYYRKLRIFFGNGRKNGMDMSALVWGRRHEEIRVGIKNTEESVKRTQR
jgi:hypothetical protein